MAPDAYASGPSIFQTINHHMNTMGQHTHVVDLGSEYQNAMMTLMTATVQFQKLVEAIAISDTTIDLKAKLKDLIDRMAKILVLPVDLAEDVLRGTVNTTLEGSVLQLHFTPEQFDRMKMH